MSILDGLYRLRNAYHRAQRHAEGLRAINALPPELQKDIGWKWTPRLRGNSHHPTKIDAERF
jgi:hypothetical protein